MQNNSPSSLWPSSDNDPFQQPHKDENDMPSSWQTRNITQQVPKWQLQTAEEQLDEQKAIRIMESKLERIKRHSQQPPMTLYNIHNDDGEDDGFTSMMEDQEGLPLLWHNNTRYDGLEDALQHQKTDQQYLTTGIWFGSWWNSFYCCCQDSPTN